jgi:hypothetical protein
MLQYFSADENCGYILHDLPLIIVDTEDVSNKDLDNEYFQAFDEGGYDGVVKFLDEHKIKYLKLDSPDNVWYNY